jgi:hypothetical protein
MVGWEIEANGEETMNLAKRRHHWPQRRSNAAIYQVTDRLHAGHIARVPAHQITATVSAWLAELGVHSPLVDELAHAVRSGDWPAAHALGECLSIEIGLAD